MKNWTDADGNQIDEESLYNWINKHKNKINSEYELIVGADSHLHGIQLRFITVVCLYQKGKGGFYYYIRSDQHKKDFKGSYPVRVRAKLFHETSLAIELATKIQENTGITPVIHIDASPPECGEVTSMFSDQLRGYVIGSGFECFLKPWSFVSSGIANKHSK